MKLMSREAWRYAALLVLLFAIAAIAVWHVIGFITDLVPQEDMQIASVLIWALTMGFMFIAGAFGLWAVQFAAEAESLRRIGKLIDAMHYVDDGLIAVDRKGIVKGSNPAVALLTANAAPDGEELASLFPSIPAADIEKLCTGAMAHEVEADVSDREGGRVLRFRSQPAEGVNLVLVSDVTAMNRLRSRRRQVARLQLVGELAQGVATDFDSLLCSISMHASMLGRLAPRTPEIGKSLDAISRASRRGAEVAAHLLRLASTPPAGYAMDAFEDHVRAAASALRDSLPEGWSVECEVDEAIGPVQLTGLQVEQIVINLGFLISDATPAPANIVVKTRHILATGAKGGAGRLAGWLLMSTGITGETPFGEPDASWTGAVGGVIGSVLKSMLDGAGGALECFRDAMGLPSYRIGLPAGVRTPTDAGSVVVPEELRNYVAAWSVMVCSEGHGAGSPDEQLRAIGMQVSRFSDIGEALGHLLGDPNMDICVFSERALGHEPRGLIKAIVKLRPSAGVVILADEPELIAASGVREDTVILPADANVARIVMGIIEARGQALKRARPGLSGRD